MDTGSSQCTHKARERWPFAWGWNRAFSILEDAVWFDRSTKHFTETIFRGLSYVTIFWMIFLSIQSDISKIHLMEVFNRLSDAEVTLRGKKCRISMTSVTYLGHVFSANEMTPDPSKIFQYSSGPHPLMLQLYDSS